MIILMTRVLKIFTAYEQSASLLLHLELMTPSNFLVSGVSTKSAWKTLGFKFLILERNADNLGREFWGWIWWGGGWKPGETRPKSSWENLLEEFAENSQAKFPKLRQTKITNLPQIRSAEPRDQIFYPYPTPPPKLLHKLLSFAENCFI